MLHAVVLMGCVGVPDTHGPCKIIRALANVAAQMEAPAAGIQCLAVWAGTPVVSKMLHA